MLDKMKHLVKDEEGQGLSEYGILVGVIAFGAVIAIVAFKDQLYALYTNITAGLKAHSPDASGNVPAAGGATH